MFSLSVFGWHAQRVPNLPVLRGLSIPTQQSHIARKREFPNCCRFEWQLLKQSRLKPKCWNQRAASNDPSYRGSCRLRQRTDGTEHYTIQLEAVDEPPQDLVHPLIPEFINRPHPAMSYSSNLSTLPPTSSRITFPQPLSSIQTRVENPRLILSRHLAQDDLVPVMPESSRRYVEKPRIKDRNKQVTLPALEISYNMPMPPGNWTRRVHPEGARYFLKEGGLIRRVWTDSDIFQHEILAQLKTHLTTIERFISEVGLPLQQDWDLVLNYFDDGNSSYTGYYFVDHTTHKVFFLDDYKADGLDALYAAPGAESECHIGYEIEAQYWFFIVLYPLAFNVQKMHVQRLRGIILHFTGDSTTSSTSTASYSLDELYRFLSLIDHMSENIDVNDEGTASLLGLFKAFSPLLFYAPNFHLRTLQSVSIDGVIRDFVLRDLMQRMNDEWERIILFGTVVLNANVAFLAIQSVDNNDSNDPHRLPAQVLSYLSVIASVGSIFLGLLLSRPFKVKAKKSQDEMQFHVASSRHSLEVLAILYSSPYALLIWGMLAFIAGFASLCFKTSGLSTRIIVGSAFLMVACIITLCIRTTWDSDKRNLFQPHALPPEHASQDDPGNSKSKLRIVTEWTRLQVLSLRQTPSSQSTYA
ncbi:hypothetical protein CPC08DRAFT_144078 [Agrocybe pediades]|nr:hypothetical protein CPC08DRAFT_144078 [Agrocybe pediades]